MQIHDSVHRSILSSDSGNIPFRGLVHLLVLILMTYTVRALIDSLEKHNFVLFKEVSGFTDTNKC
jgi:predicted ABC-type exoprotein transport system permease subunit